MSHEFNEQRVGTIANAAWEALMKSPHSNEVLAALGMVTGWIHSSMGAWKAMDKLADREQQAKGPTQLTKEEV